MLIVVDIDMTLADARPRLEKAGKMPHRDDRASFQQWLDTLQPEGSLLSDPTIPELLDLIKDVEDCNLIVFLTGRSDIHRKETQAWLNEQEFTGPLYMRAQDDWRSAKEFKRSSLKRIKELYGWIPGHIAIDDDSEGDCSAMYLEEGFVHLKVFIP